MDAMCLNCHKTHEFGWFWPGKIKGYGNYDLKCSICGEWINKKKDNNENS